MDNWMFNCRIDGIMRLRLKNVRKVGIIFICPVIAIFDVYFIKDFNLFKLF